MMNDKLSLFGFWKVQKVRKVGIHFLHIFLKENPNVFFSIVGLVLQYPIGKKPLAAIALQRPLADAQQLTQVLIVKQLFFQRGIG